MKLNVAVFFGGQSVEHEVSIISAHQAIESLDKEKYNVLPIYISKDQKLYFGEALFNMETFKNLDAIPTITTHIDLVNQNNQVEILPVKTSLFGKKVLGTIDVAIPVMHGTYGEDGTIQGYFEMLKVPYAGCDLFSAAVGQDKVLQKHILHDAGLPITNWFWVYAREMDDDPVGVLTKVRKLIYPVILKPDDQSGSKDVKKAYSKEEAEEYLANTTGNTVVQEYVEGRSFSIEVIGNGTEYLMPEITEVVIDKEYDCKRIIAPAKITPSERKQMMKMAELLAKSIQIKGIFDIEVISQEGILKILEIDARMPSQTPISVYHSCGINMVELLVQAYTKDTMRCTKSKEKSVMYQQIVVKNSTIHVLGEHVMATCGRLHLEENFFGAEEAITDYSPGKKDFSAIVITTGQTEEKAYDKFLACVNNIKEKLGKQISFIEG